MSGLKQPILDIINQLGPANPLTPTRIWNNQLHSQKQGQAYSTLMPAFYVEVSPLIYLPLGNGFSEAELTVVIHILHEIYDPGDGTLDQDLAVFALRDQAIKSLAGFQPTACSSLILSGETLSFDHDNIYEYKIDFKTTFIDSKGSPYDAGSTVYQQSTPPITEITTVTQGIVPAVQDTSTYTINQ